MAENVLSVLHVGFGVGVVFFGYRLAAWLKLESAAWWVVGFFLPIINLLVTVGLIRRTAESFCAQKAPMSWFGPQLRVLARSRGNVEVA